MDKVYSVLILFQLLLLQRLYSKVLSNLPWNLTCSDPRWPTSWPNNLFPLELCLSLLFQVFCLGLFLLCLSAFKFFLFRTPLEISMHVQPDFMGYPSILTFLCLCNLLYLLVCILFIFVYVWYQITNKQTNKRGIFALHPKVLYPNWITMWSIIYHDEWRLQVP